MMESLFPDYQPKKDSEKKDAKPRICRVRTVSPEHFIQVDPGTLLIDALREGGLYIAQQCGGFAICGWCKVRVVEGGEHLSPIGPEEQRLFDWGQLAEGERASCQAEVHGDVVVHS